MINFKLKVQILIATATGIDIGEVHPRYLITPDRCDPMPMLVRNIPDYPFNSVEAAELSIPMLMFVIKRRGSKALCGWSDSGPPLHPVTFCNN